MTVTVGIPTTGERPVLRQSVEAAIRSATLLSREAEVLVVVNGRADAPGLGRVDSPMLRLVHLDQPNVSAARNCAIAQARHDAVLFADDDVLVPEPWCAELGAALCDQGCAVVTAPVRIPVSGPVTAHINYQRKFDSQPPRPDDPGTLLTANFGLRRDLVPEHVRFDESFTFVGEDVDLGYQLWAAGIHFRLLTDATPVPHELPEGIEPVIERCLRYGKGTVLSLTKRGLGPKLLPAFGPRYQAAIGPDDRRLSRYVEFTWPQVREAFQVYASIFHFAYLVGVLHALGEGRERPVIRLDAEGLAASWQLAADRAGERVSALSARDWQSLPVDYSRLAGGQAAADQQDAFADAVIADLKAALREHAPLVAELAGPAGRRGQGRAWAAALAGAHTQALVRQTLDELRGRGHDTPLSKADIDNFARVTGLPFRVCCEMIEREFAAA